MKGTDQCCRYQISILEFQPSPISLQDFGGGESPVEADGVEPDGVVADGDAPE